MGPFLAFSRLVDAMNTRFGRLAEWMVLAACAVSAGNAFLRYGFSLGSNAWLEAQWYLFAGMVMLGASYTLKKNEHVRVDLWYMTLSRRGQIWIDIIGIVLFLIPACLLLAWLSWPFFLQSFPNEVSTNAGGLLRWPVKILVPIGFVLVALQGFSELIKRVAGLTGMAEITLAYEKPLQ